MPRKTFRSAVKAKEEPAETPEMENGSDPIEVEVVEESTSARKPRATARKTKAEKPEAKPKKESTALTKSSGFQLKGLKGDVDVNAFAVPTLRLVQKMSKEADADQDGDPGLVGHFLLGEDDMDTEVSAIIMSVEIKFREALSEAERKRGVVARSFDTQDEAKAECGSSYSAYGIADMLVYDEDNAEETFGKGDDAEHVRFARFYFQGVGFGALRSLNTTLMKREQQYWDTWMVFSSEKGVSKKDNTTYRALQVEVTDDATSDDLRAYAENWSSQAE